MVKNCCPTKLSDPHDDRCAYWMTPIEEPKKGTEAWIMTQSGRMFYFENPHPASIVIEDIANALAQICRFTGHTRCHYSVAEHCIRVSWLAEKKYGRQFAREGLLHDAAEAYVSDLNGPLKRLVGEGYKQWEDVAERALGAKFNFTVPKSKEVKDCDGVVYLTEKRDLFPPYNLPFTSYPDKVALDDPIIPMSAELSRLLFLHRFEEVKTW
jgi:uncharacterized protein